MLPLTGFFCKLAEVSRLEERSAGICRGVAPGVGHIGGRRGSVAGVGLHGSGSDRQ